MGSSSRPVLVAKIVVIFMLLIGVYLFLDVYEWKNPQTDVSEQSTSPVFYTKPQWSPDGNWIAYVSRSGTLRSGVTDIWLVRPDGSEQQNLTNGRIQTPSIVYDLIWSSDMQSLAFVLITEVSSDIWVVNIENGELRNLTPDNEFLDFTAHNCFLSDDSVIILSDREGEMDVFELDLETLGTSNITENVFGDVGLLTCEQPSHMTQGLTMSHELF